ncbi:hypothetical protein [Deminuibacter soli]|uniref:Carbohydrate-binding family V/XII n=1 Tax=Deminuibacter soli TaxID=2291815 RepID=A0A3E1NNJ2_9BACT|nr:hypothetical protein [Deminuibacter soli]RFM29492.1 hypothetical protein DXN05_00455 [Deminuibacter soli]
MNTVRLVILCVFAAFGFTAANAQYEWPKVINASDGSVIKVYEPQPESFAGNVLKSRSAISFQAAGQTEPVFGTFWSVSTVETDRDNRRVSVQSVHVPNVKFPSDVDANAISFVKTTLEAQLPAVESDLPLDAILTSLDETKEEKKLSSNFNNKPPKIYYASNPSLLITIDGTPKLKHNSDWDVDAVVNTPFTIVKNNDNNYYLYGGKKWYRAKDALGPYNYTSDVPGNLKKIETSVNAANNADPGYSDSAANARANVVSDIIVTTQPAELIQTKGDPHFTSIDGTSLQYADNSENDIFYNQNDQQYYVLISGRWFTSSKIDGSWSYISSGSLPSDFAKIPEGSPKDNVLASIAGTQAAREAVMDAQIPQTAKVDRRTATTNVTYDGAPRFEAIPGTHLQYATNTQSSVLNYNGRYYAVDKGVWFVSDSPTGPWTVSTDRPDDVESIPPSSPAYNLKYVYVYDSSPDYVYMGYTPGYLNNYVYEATVVYGTGYAYTPWWGNYYYPRPYTWGFGVSYNPWWGWGLGFGFSTGWFNVGFGSGIWGGWGGGWWGPAIYRPPYHYWGGYYGHGYYGHGYYGRGGYGYGGFNRTVVYNRTTVNNIYNYRRDVVSNNRNIGPRRTFGSTPRNVNTPGTGSNPGIGGRSMNNNNRVFSDRQGNVYQQGGRTTNTQGNAGQWQQRNNSNRSWQPVDNNRSEVIQNLNRQQQQQSRGEQRTQNFQQFRNNAGFSRPSSSGAPSFSRPSSSGGGGFSRPSSGGGGSRPSRR